MRTTRFLPALALVALPFLTFERAAGAVAPLEGNSQSPIDLRSEQVIFVRGSELPDLKFRYPRRVDLDLVNTGETVRADLPEGAATLRVGRQEYALLQFHFHTPSEHLVDGSAAPAELHLVHRSAGGELMVVGVFLEEGGEHVLDELLVEAPEEEGLAEEVRDFPLRALLPRDLDSYRYDGSLTTPPFTEGVRWAVLAQPLELDGGALEHLREIFPAGNAREAQPLHDRAILSDLGR